MNKEKLFNEMQAALENLVVCPAFTGTVFEKDKESHRAWTLARGVLQSIPTKNTVNGENPAQKIQLNLSEDEARGLLHAASQCEKYPDASFRGFQKLAKALYKQRNTTP